MRIGTQHIGDLLKKQLTPIYLVTGDEPLQHSEVSDSVRLAAKNGGYFTREVLSVETGFVWGEFIQTANSLSIFADKKIIDLRLPSGKPGVEGAKVLIDYCQHAPEDTLLLITAPKISAATLKTKWCQAIDKAGTIVQIWPLEGVALIQWLQHKANVRGLQIEQEAIKLLASRTEGNLLIAAQEIEKLYILYGNSPISKQAVEQSVTDNARFDVFKLTDSLLAGKTSRANKILGTLKTEGIAAPVIVWALARETRLLFNIKIAINEGGNKEIVLKSHRLWDKRKQLVAIASSRIKIQTLKKILLLCSKADRQIKGQEQGDYWETLLSLCSLFH